MLPESEQREENDMDVQLDQDQRREMFERRGDVITLAVMMSNSGRHVSPEEAYLAWRRASDSSSANWLVFDETSADEIDGAFTSYAFDAVREDARTHFERLLPDVAAFVRDHLSANAVDADKGDVIKVATHEYGDVLGLVREDSGDDLSLLETIADHFGYAIPTHAVMFDRSVILEQMGLKTIG